MFSSATLSGFKTTTKGRSNTALNKNDEKYIFKITSDVLERSLWASNKSMTERMFSSFSNNGDRCWWNSKMLLFQFCVLSIESATVL